MRLTEQQSKQHQYELEFYGFTLVGNVMSSDEMDVFRDILIREDKRMGSDTPTGARQIFNLIAQDTAFFKTIDHPRVLPLVEHVLGKDIILGSLNARIPLPGASVQPWHGDLPQSLIKDGSPLGMNTVWMVDDFTKVNGATQIVPGSHRSHLAGPPDDMDVKHAYDAVAPAGSVLIFNCQCWHGSGANTTDRHRYAFFVHYRVSANSLFQIDPHKGFPPEWWDQLSLRQKELLRMTEGLGSPRCADLSEGY